MIDISGLGKFRILTDVFVIYRRYLIFLNLLKMELIFNISSFSIGDKTAAETLRHSLALGADDAFHVLTSDPIDTVIQPLLVAKIIKLYVQKHKFDMVLLGKQVTIIITERQLMMTQIKQLRFFQLYWDGRLLTTLRQ